jgi:hypothetical protein
MWFFIIKEVTTTYLCVYCKSIYYLFTLYFRSIPTNEVVTLTLKQHLHPDTYIITGSFVIFIRGHYENQTKHVGLVQRGYYENQTKHVGLVQRGHYENQTKHVGLVQRGV